MANSLYATAKESFLAGEIDLTQNNVKLLLVKSGYIVDLSGHMFVSDIDSSYIAGRSSILDNVSITLGVFDADNETIEKYGNTGFSYIIIYTDSGNDSTSRLIAYIDTADGLPVEATLADATVIINWSNTIYKIFSL
jgi:hypothetical protein